MNPGRSNDEAILRELNDAYLHSGQNSDVARYEEFLAGDFTASLPGYQHRDSRWLCVAGEVVAQGE
jgi:hypothetical protein